MIMGLEVESRLASRVCHSISEFRAQIAGQCMRFRPGVPSVNSRPSISIGGFLDSIPNPTQKMRVREIVFNYLWGWITEGGGQCIKQLCSLKLVTSHPFKCYLVASGRFEAV